MYQLKLTREIATNIKNQTMKIFWSNKLCYTEKLLVYLRDELNEREEDQQESDKH